MENQNVIPMKRISLKKAFKNRVFTNVSKVRENHQGFKFVTVIDNSGKSNNVYLGRKSSEQVIVGQDIPAELLKRADFVLATNEQDEQRLKLSLNGDSGYTSMESIFGDDELDATETEVLNQLRAEMTARVEENAEAVGAQA
ncbi:MAG TPA: hypothetical protein VF680_16960 [Allosphingosinicella sp.]|jgi:hypothetical protein